MKPKNSESDYENKGFMLFLEGNEIKIYGSTVILIKEVINLPLK